MSNARNWRPSPAMVVALIALFVALAGTAWAAQLAENSVKSKQIKNGEVKDQDLDAAAVTDAALADGSVNSAKVLDNTLGTADLAANSVNHVKLADNSVRGGDFLLNETETFNLPSISAGSCSVVSAQQGPWAGVGVGNHVFVTAPYALDWGLVLRATTTADAVWLFYCNVTGSAIDPPSLAYDFLVISD